MTETEYKEVRLGPDKLQIPSDWDVEKIEPMISVLTGDSFSSDKFNEEGKGLPLVRIRNLQDGETDTYFSGEYKEKYVIEPEDLLIGMDGEFHTVRWKGEEALLNQRVAKVETNEEINQDFLFYKLIGEIREIQARTPATTVKHLSKSDINEIRIPLPPLPEQRRIAEILSTVDEAIQQTDEIIETSKELKKGLMQDLLTKGIGHDEFKEVQLGPMTVEIAKSWDVEKFGDIFNKRRESYDDEDQQINYVGLEHLETGKTEISGYKKDGAEKSSTRKFREGDILYGKLRPYLDKAAVAPFDGICSSDIIPIYSVEDSTQGYLKYLIHHKIMYNRAVSTQKGTNLPRTSWGALASAEIPLPPLDEQREIAEKLSTVDEKIRQEEEYREKLEELKKGLMQDLLTGKVRVEPETA